ncbi:hypothetical protein LXL04_003822 [Taraxacum kok-saghyz]
MSTQHSATVDQRPASLRPQSLTDSRPGPSGSHRIATNDQATNSKSDQQPVSLRRRAKAKKASKPPLAPTDVPASSVNKSRKRSPWWSHYVVDEEVPDVAEYKYCHAMIGSASKSGTGPLKNHQLSCKLSPQNIIDKKQKLLDLESRTVVSDDGSIETMTIPRLWEFNQDVIRKALSYMLIVDELPFSFVEREVGHSGVLIGRAIEKCLVEWGLKIIMTITVDNASSNDVAVNHLRNVLNHWECGVLKGAFLHMRCAAHILNLVVNDGLMDVNLSVKKIRTLVKYVRSSPARLLKFKSSVEEEKIENSNFAKEVKKCEGGVITDEDWVNVNSLLPFLKIFLDATKRFSGSRYVTSNAYVQEIFGIGKVIDGSTVHADKSIKNMALKMQTKYKKYWGDVAKLNQFISSLPQNKTEEEVSSSTPSDSHNCTWGDEVEMDIEQLMTTHFQMDMGSCEGNLKKTELDKYLGEDREAMDVNFDILKWWGINKCRYPVLSKMARDVLAIPVSTVASEVAFSTGGWVLDSFRTSLTPRMVEALVCTQDWVRDCHDPINVDDILLEMEKLEEEALKDLTVDQPTIIIDETVDEVSDNIRVSESFGYPDFGYPDFRIYAYE